MIAALLLLAALQGGDTTARHVSGHVARGTRAAQIAIPNQLVVLHRVGRDRSGPLDSMRTSARGEYSFRYRPTGDSSAIYFATTQYGGIVYPTAPFRGWDVSGEDASIIVFDTTSAPIPIKVGARHVIIGEPQANGHRPIGEVYDLQNDTTVTVIARDSVTPVWATDVPAAATRFQLNANGNLAAGAMTKRGSTVGLFAPVSPGIRQVAFTYELPTSAFPLRITAGKPTGVLEVLVQEPTARVEAPSLREVPAVSADGRTFRRFLAQDLPAGAVLRVEVPRLTIAERETIYRIVLYLLLAGMVVALAYAARRGKRMRPEVAVLPVPETRSRLLVRAIATLDVDFDRAGVGATDPGAREEYQSARASLKRELVEVLAAERGTS